MKTKYRKCTFNLPFDEGYGTFVEKLSVGKEIAYIVGRKNLGIHKNPNEWDELSAKDMWEGNYY